MSIAKYNKRETRFTVDTSGFDFMKLGELYDKKDPGHVFPIYGLYINRKSKYGDSPFAASDGYFIGLPNHMCDQVKEILKDDQVIADINACKCGIVIRPYDDDNGVTHYSADFADIEGE